MTDNPAKILREMLQGAGFEITPETDQWLVETEKQCERMVPVECVLAGHQLPHECCPHCGHPWQERGLEPTSA